jgi:alpha-glucoside transport system permease protein
MIWIQTGFAMVVLSAALKGVPEDQIEAAKVDGATELDIFWKITIPTIRSTIAVVVTTLIILVMKVYDIVKVMTNGEFGTEVLANAMFNQAFTFRSFGRGSALATILFLAVLPMMYINIRRVREEQMLR